MDTDYEREINRLIHHIEAWANASIPQTEENITALEDVLADGFMIVRPDSHIIKGEDLANWFRHAAYGGEKGIVVTIKNIQLRHRFGDTVFALYEEWKQMGDTPPTGTLGSVLFRKKAGTPNNLEWLHVHETKLP